MTAQAHVLVACHDLLFRSKIEATLRHMGLQPLPLRASDDPAVILAAGRPSLAIVDLNMDAARWHDIVAAARASDAPPRIMAFGAHVDRTSQHDARALGCDLVVANSRLARELPSLVERLLSGT